MTADVKTEERLLSELSNLRQELARLENVETELENTKKMLDASNEKLQQTEHELLICKQSAESSVQIPEPTRSGGEVAYENAELIEINNALLKEISERKQAEEALSQSESNLKRAQEVAGIGCWRMSLDDNLLWWSEEIFRIFGMEPGLNLRYEHFLEKVHTEDRPSVDEAWNAALRGEPYNIEHRIVVGNEVKWVREIAKIEINDQGDQVTGVGTVQDITQWKLAEMEREKLKAQLTASQKMEAIGTLAGGIAHDFNNILSAIMGYSELALYSLPEDHPVQGKISLVLAAADRAVSLVNQILSFSRRSDQVQKPCKLAPVVKEALKLMRSTLPTTIEIRQKIEAESDTVLADPTQIHQVVMNLCANASHAMREAGGILEVNLKRVELDEKTAGLYVELEPGEYQRLTVSDTGCGMDQYTLDRIFEPFFTTKELGEGTGLGLSVVHGIVKNHGGAISVYSEQGTGTAFHIYLPLLEAEADVRNTYTRSTLPRGTENILLVDDEPILVNLEREMLEILGYRVTTRTSGPEALEKFKAEPESFDLVLTDMTMPQMTGVKLSEELLRIRPDLKIILCTGFSPQISENKIELIGIRRLLMKPLVQREIAETIREVLDEN